MSLLSVDLALDDVWHVRISRSHVFIECVPPTSHALDCSTPLRPPPFALVPDHDLRLPYPTARAAGTRHVSHTHPAARSFNPTHAR